MQLQNSAPSNAKKSALCSALLKPLSSLFYRLTGVIVSSSQIENYVVDLKTEHVQFGFMLTFERINVRYICIRQLLLFSRSPSVFNLRREKIVIEQHTQVSKEYRHESCRHTARKRQHVIHGSGG